jgi:hypothetical protein
MSLSLFETELTHLTRSFTHTSSIRKLEVTRNLNQRFVRHTRLTSQYFAGTHTYAHSGSNVVHFVAEIAYLIFMIK